MIFISNHLRIELSPKIYYSLGDEKHPAINQVKNAVTGKIGKFTKIEIMELCPGLSRSSVENSLTKLVEEQYIERHGRGRSTFYVVKYN